MRRAILLLTMITAVLLVASGVALAAAGSLDLSFGGGDGKVLTDYGRVRGRCMLRSSEQLQGLAYAREGQTRWGTISVSVSLVKWVAILQMGR